MPAAYRCNSRYDGQGRECDVDGDERQTFFTDAVVVRLVMGTVILTARSTDTQCGGGMRYHMACECRLRNEQANDEP